jgi:hypothetical protein
MNLKLVRISNCCKSFMTLKLQNIKLFKKYDLVYPNVLKAGACTIKTFYDRNLQILVIS